MVEVNTLLVVEVDNIQFDTLHVKSEFFPEINGICPQEEISKKKRTEPRFKIGDFIPVKVINVDRNFVDCTRKEMSSEERSLCFELNKSAKRVYNEILGKWEWEEEEKINIVDIVKKSLIKRESPVYNVLEEYKSNEKLIKYSVDVKSMELYGIIKHHMIQISEVEGYTDNTKLEREDKIANIINSASLSIFDLKCQFELGIDEVLHLILDAIFSITEKNKGGLKQLFKLLKNFKPVICKYIENTYVKLFEHSKLKCIAGELEVLIWLEEYVTKYYDNWGKDYGEILYKLYDLEIVDEEANFVLNEEKDNKVEKYELMQKHREQFINWLKEE
jgi:hypothetical protein